MEDFAFYIYTLNIFYLSIARQQHEKFRRRDVD